MREVEDVSLGVCVGRLVGLQGEGAVVEGQPPEVHMVGVVEAPRRLLATPLVLPFCRGDVAADGEEPNYTNYSLEVRVLYPQFVSLMLFLSHLGDLKVECKMLLFKSISI